jgi:TRAP-type C4-dicarboxylate transport system permease small subunit
MSPQARKVLQLMADNVFWVFLVLMIVFGSIMDSPWVNVGLTAR